MSLNQRSGTVQNSSESPDDIPFALRDVVEGESGQTLQRSLNPSQWWVMGLTAVLSLGLLATVSFFFILRPQLTADPSAPAVPPGETEAENATTSEEPDDTLLGHRRYEAVDPETLVSVDSSGDYLLQEAAADDFIRMQDAARQEGVGLVLLSAYRSLEDQQYLFFDVKSIRGQDTSTRAEVSAPPGYSEHHTGYAIDIGDADQPSTNLSVRFEETAAFQWLEENAGFYSFELSFLPDNEEGIAYEPWHWRYVGNQESLELFYRQQDLPPETLAEPSEAAESLLETP